MHGAAYGCYAAVYYKWVPFHTIKNDICDYPCLPWCCTQVEERLRFYEDGVAPRKNLDVMHEVMGNLKAAQPEGEATAAAAGTHALAEWLH